MEFFLQTFFKGEKSFSELTGEKVGVDFKEKRKRRC